MLSNKIYYILTLVMIMVTGCIEPFTPDDLEHKPMLYIQGIISDSPEVNGRVLLSNTSQLYGETEFSQIFYINTSGATVYVRRNDGQEFQFTQAGGYSSGFSSSYRPATPLPPMEPGSSYKLIIITTEGYRFESDYEEYIPTPEIESITYAAVEEKRSEEGTLEQGYRFYISSMPDENRTGYFRWELDYTYRYSVPFTAYYKWTGSQLTVAPSYDYTYCFKNGKAPGIYIGSTAGLEENRAVSAPLHFVSQYGDLLQNRYSLRVVQYRISKEAFSFWFNLRKTISETGGLYETQPFRIKGNLRCVSDESINVAGVFEVASVTEKRVFVDRPVEFPVFSFRCRADTIGNGITWDKVPAGSYIMEIDETYMTAPDECFDCRLKGGYIARPPFWEQ